MDKEPVIIGALCFALAGFAIYAVIHEFMPVFLAVTQFTGVILIILALTVSFGSLFTLVVIVMDRPTQGNPTTGSIIAIEYMKQRRITKINNLSLKAPKELTGYYGLNQYPGYDGRDYYHE
ncbi:Uncharacterized protein dnl_63030 [Desulfonema limicola]|uniref:Uncharacterized protein n=1 Tax=Desulfonema limicola TaxID=45656 RepID=A0A975GJR5_9BACT|nr:hypothetical protein [Desulfonema limicola]QTA83879.1 Uncharacterized protein dnl_63030 [Desulfonema limicola]